MKEQYETNMRIDNRFIIDPSQKYKCKTIAISQSNTAAPPQLLTSKDMINENNGVLICSV